MVRSRDELAGNPTVFLALALLACAWGCGGGAGGEQGGEQGGASYTLAVQKSGPGGGNVRGAGISCGADCSESLSAGTTVTLIASPDPGSVFDGWSGCDATSGTSCTVVLGASKTVTATFGSASTTDHTLTVARAGSGTGTVTASGIDCGADCTVTVTAGTTVTLTAAAASGSTFAGWSGCASSSGATCTVVLDADRTVTATFDHPTASYTLTVQRAGAGAGTVTGNGIDCGSDCSQQFPPGTQVTLTAAPAAGSVFRSWSNCSPSASTTCTVSMTFSKTVTANFDPGSQTVTLPAQDDNLVLASSTDPAVQNTVYRRGELAIGCNWVYTSLTGIQDFVCAASLVRFDLSALAGKTIESATLRLTVDYFAAGSPRRWSLEALADAWNPATVTWNVVGGLRIYTASTLTSAPPATSTVDLDLTVHVQNWVSRAWVNNGVLLVSESYAFPFTTSLDAYAFYSLEGGTAIAPMLTIRYH